MKLKNNKLEKFRSWRKSNKTKSAVALIVSAAVLIELIAAVQYWYIERNIRTEVENRAKTELQVKSLEIQRVMSAVEAGLGNMVWAVERAAAASPDSVASILSRIVEQNATIVGCGAGFVEKHFPEKGIWFEPYAARREDGKMETLQIGSSRHNYFNADWFARTCREDKARWTEPYYDEAGARMMLSTYTMPLHDEHGRVIAVIGADVSLDWLSSVVNAHHIYPTSYNLIISSDGRVLACPVESLVLRRNIDEVVGSVSDTTVKRISREMERGYSGKASLTDEKGETNYIFYAPIEGETGWSMAVVCSDSEIYQGLRQMRFILSLLMLAGLLLLGYIIFRSIHVQTRLQTIGEENARIESELRIASGIQAAMLPKASSSFPECDDLRVCATLEAAREVGGDLYDYYLRDERLFFCIADVSGKGVPASLVMAVTRALFRSVSARETAPERIVGAMNDVMAANNEQNMFVTLFVGVLDLASGMLNYCNAGHESPLLVGDGVGLLPCETNLAVGMAEGWEYIGQEALILPLTTIFLYTDGLTEAENAEKELFSKERMKGTAATVLSEGRQAPETLIADMMEVVSQFVGDARQSDDLTMLAIQYTGRGTAVRFRRSLLLEADINEVTRLEPFVDEACDAADLDAATTMQMNLAVEEAVVNVMNYAYPAHVRGVVELEAFVDTEDIVFVVADSGQPFDPTSLPEPDISLPAEQRPVGGLGVFLLNQYMDEVNYVRKDGKNVLTLRKHIAVKPSGE